MTSRATPSQREAEPGRATPALPAPVPAPPIWLSQCPPTTNKLYANAAKGRRKASNYARWITGMGTELLTQRPAKHHGRVRVRYVFGFPDRRKRDVFNYEKSITDLLVRHGVIPDDSTEFLRGGELLLAEDCGMEFTGVRITITPLEAV